MALYDKTKELIGDWLIKSQETFEEKECMNCIHFNDGCVADYCPGHAIKTK